MNRQDVEKIITASLKPIFGFALKRCKNIQDAEDLSQEIAIRSFRALIGKDDVADMEKFIWTVAHNALNNYYRDNAKSVIGLSLDEISETIANEHLEMGADDNTEFIHRLQTEIAYLSKLQRRIVIAYYFENRKQTDIAKELNIPLGTVKWHLFEAKKELKRGMDMNRKSSQLKFNPIRFQSYGINGSVGKKSFDEFFRSALSQNICYCVRNTPKTINQIADDIGVSPVYVETEVEFLEQYGFLAVQNNKYITNFIITEPTEKLLKMQNEMYGRAAELFANDLYDELMKCGILEDERILCNHTLAGSTKEKPLRDKNFLLWALIPYIAALSGETLMDKTISFNEVATLRPDGAHNICQAVVIPDDMVLPEDCEHMKNWCGPMCNEQGGQSFWQINSTWCDRGESGVMKFSQTSGRVLSLYAHEAEGYPLSKEDYAWLSQEGYLECFDYNGGFATLWKIPVLKNAQINKELLAIGERIKIKYKEEFEALKVPYIKAMLESVPTHLRKAKAYELQYTFHSDGWFLLHCIIILLKNGKLKEPTKEQQKVLTTLIVL